MKLSKRNILYWAIAIHTVTAFLSVGFLHPDEYYYGLNFALTKLGLLDTSFLTTSWEFNTQIRPWSLPYFLVFLSSPLKALNITNPHTYIQWIRLVVSLWSLFVAHLFANWAEQFLHDVKFKKLHYFFHLLLWPTIFMHARISSDNIATSFFLLVPIFLFSKSKRDLMIAGALIGVSFSLRHQLGLMGLCIGLFALFSKKITYKNFFVILVPSIVLYVGMGFALDILGYGQTTFTAINYLKQNLIEGKMANFGVSPWWYYFKLIAIKISPSFGLPLIFFLFRFILKRGFHFLFWVIVPFFIFHSSLGHKELRFLFPLLPFAIVAMMIEIEYVKFFWKEKLITFMIVTNLIGVPFACFRAANTPMKMYEFLYENQVTSLSVHQDRKGRLYKFELPSLLPSQFQSTDEPYGAGWHLVANFTDMKKFDGACSLKYSSYPRWLLNLNPLDFAKKSNIQMLYYCAAPLR
jgi:phosphatidylinositol glycan class B